MNHEDHATMRKQAYDLHAENRKLRAQLRDRFQHTDGDVEGWLAGLRLGLATQRELWRRTFFEKLGTWRPRLHAVDVALTWWERARVRSPDLVPKTVDVDRMTTGDLCAFAERMRDIAAPDWGRGRPPSSTPGEAS